MIPAEGRLGVAVSGGADSVFLLHALLVLDRAPLAVVHVNHRLRGGESDRDEDFVAGLADRHGLPCHVYRAPSPPRGNLEQYCRRERMAFFRELRAAGKVERVATGHTRSDQAETVLMRVLRGTGPRGLRGILPRTREGIVRPLIELDRLEIRRFLQEKGLPWLEDSSNRSPRFLRNRVRAEILPLLRQWQPNVESVLGHLARASSIEEDYWEQAVLDALEKAAIQRHGETLFDCRVLRELHPALAARVLRAASPAPLDWEHTEAIVALVGRTEGSGSVTFEGGEAVRSFHWLRLASSRNDRKIQPEMPIITLPLQGCISSGPYLIETSPEPFPPQAYTEGEEDTTLDWERIQGSLHIRNWRDGDRFYPVGASGERTVKKLFQNARVPSWERKLWPIIYDDARIVWVRQFGVAEGLAASPASTFRLHIRCRPINPNSLV